ncbi:Exonuclease V, chloroplastic [Dichanthelium oligosanthes]|uniref:Exonuclease V, chloroplastic n=1 Tax=Dichanthelium oligosanthes TaxID=888268 RepID=A0A1E5VX45_9POAL|nr:Exonuclease V, chloroplastic [Dichanthelium oligosanthes]
MHSSPSAAAAPRPGIEEIPVEIVSDEEMAFIEAALAAAAAGARPLLSSAARRAAAPLSCAAYSAAGGDIEDSPPPQRSLLARFRERRALAVTDITATEWCEKQMEFVLEHGKPERTEAMKAGSERHAQLEQEVVVRVDVAIRSAEELWAVKFMNFIVGTNQLMFEGITREIPVIGLVEGSWMIGIIDEIRMPMDGISFQPILVDTKTRVRPTIPSEAQKRNGRFATLTVAFLTI